MSSKSSVSATSLGCIGSTSAAETARSAHRDRRPGTAHRMPETARPSMSRTAVSIASGRPRWVSTATRRRPEPAGSAGVTCPSIGLGAQGARRRAARSRTVCRISASSRRPAAISAVLDGRDRRRLTRRAAISFSSTSRCSCLVSTRRASLGGTQTDDTAGHVLARRPATDRRPCLGPRSARSPRRCPARRSPTRGTATRSRCAHRRPERFRRRLPITVIDSSDQRGRDPRVSRSNRSSAKYSRLPVEPGSRLGTTWLANQPCSCAASSTWRIALLLQVGLSDDAAAPESVATDLELRLDHQQHDPVVGAPPS